MLGGGIGLRMLPAGMEFGGSSQSVSLVFGEVAAARRGKAIVVFVLVFKVLEIEVFGIADYTEHAQAGLEFGVPFGFEVHEVMGAVGSESDADAGEFPGMGANVGEGAGVLAIVFGFETSGIDHGFAGHGLEVLQVMFPVQDQFGVGGFGDSKELGDVGGSMLVPVHVIGIGKRVVSKFEAREIGAINRLQNERSQVLWLGRGGSNGFVFLGHVELWLRGTRRRRSEIR